MLKGKLPNHIRIKLFDTHHCFYLENQKNIFEDSSYITNDDDDNDNNNDNNNDNDQKSKSKFNTKANTPQ